MLRKYLVLGIMMGALALTGCGAEEKGNSDTKDKNVANESSSENSSENKNTITPTDTISGLELVASYEFPKGSCHGILPYNNLVFSISDNDVQIKDIYNNEDSQLLDYEGAKNIPFIYYGEDYILFVVKTTPDNDILKEMYHIILVTKDGKTTYVDTIDYDIYFMGSPYFLNKDGNLIYINDDNSMTCLNPHTCEKIYTQNLGENSCEYLFNKYLGKIKVGNQNKIYNLATGDIIYETTIDHIHVVGDLYYPNKEIYIIDSNYAIMERDANAEISKYSVYDEKGSLTYSNNNPEEIPVIYEIGWNNSMVCKNRNSDSLFSGYMILRADLTPIVENCKEKVSLFDEETKSVEYACKSGISIYTNSSGNYGYIVTDTETIEFTFLEYVHYEDWCVIYTDTNNKRYLLNMANGSKTELEVPEKASMRSIINQLSPDTYVDKVSQTQKVYFYEHTDTLTNIYDENCNLLFSQKKEKFDPSVYGSTDMNQILLLSDSYTIVYNAETGEQIKLNSDELLGRPLTVVKDMYLMFSKTNSETGTSTLTQLNLETNETSELITVANDVFWFSNDIVLAANSKSVNDIIHYDIYTYK